MTDRHIADGRACMGSECPIALAVLDALAAQGVKVAIVQVGAGDVDVTLNDSDDDDSRRRFRADLDGHASSFIEAFDDADGSDERDENIVAPFELELAWLELAR
ncbi:MAG TPA: hypothetical protein VGG75_40085 [Trebonia sp.]